MANAGMMSLSGLGAALDQNAATEAARRKAELAQEARRIAREADAAQQSHAVSEKSMQSAQSTQQQQLEVLGGVADQLTKAQEAMKLSDSDNPMDRLQLWMLQQSDSGYTREGNLNRLKYLQGASEALGTIGAINQQGYQDQLTQIENNTKLNVELDQGELEMLQAQEKVGKERIASEQLAQQALAGNLTTNNTMQNAALANVEDIDTLDAALQQARNSPDGTSNVGGIQISGAMLQSRKDALLDRQFLVGQRDIGRVDNALSDLEMPDLIRLQQEAAGGKGKVQIAPGVEVSSARLTDAIMTRQERIANNKMTGYALSNASEAQGLKLQEKLAATMMPEELNTLITNGGVDPNDGFQYDIGLLKQQRDIKLEAQAQGLQNEMGLATLQGPVQPAVSHSNYLDSLKPQPNSPLNAMIENSRSRTGVAASMMDSEDPYRKMAGLAQVSQERANIDTAITQEANRMSLGDKAKAQAYEYTIRGQAIPPDLVEGAILERVRQGKDIGEWLSPESRGLFGTAYRQSLAEQDQMDPARSVSTSDKEAIAARTAMQQVLGKATDGVSESMFTSQFGSVDNPLPKAGVSQRQLLDLIHQADVSAAKAMVEANPDLKDAVAAAMAGKADVPGLAAQQNANLLIALDKIQPGLADQYVQWWDSDSRSAMVSDLAGRKLASVAGNLTSTAEFSLVMPTLQDTASGYSSNLIEGKNQIMGAELAKQHSDYVTFGGDATAKQVFLLDSDPKMSNTQKQRAMTLIMQPLISQAAAQQMDPATTARYIEQNLRNARFDDPEQRKLQSLILAGRDDALTSIDKFAASQELWQMSGVFSGYRDPNKKSIGDTVGAFSWWTELQSRNK